MRVCLFNPPNLKGTLATPDDYYSWVYREKSVSLVNYVCPPYTLCLLSALIKKELPGVDVRVFDARLEREIEPAVVMGKLREEYAPDLVVMLLGAYTLEHDAEYVPRDVPAIGVICPTDVPPRLALRYFDMPLEYIVKGELENTVIAAARNLLEKGSLKDSPGLLIREGEELRETVDCPQRPLKDLPLPDYDAVPMERYFDLLGSDFSFKRTYFDNDRYATIFNNRGCVFSCRFCNLGIGAYDSKEPSQTVAEMRYFVEKHSCDNFVFMGNEFTGNADAAKALCREIIGSGLRVNWSSGDRVEFIDEELVSLMARSGCRCLMFGVETADLRLRKKYNRVQSDEQFEKVFGWCRKYGILTYANIIGGLVGEDGETVRRNTEFVRRVRPDRISMHYFFVAPGSEFYYELLEGGGLRHHDWARYYWHFADKTDIYFSHGSYGTYAELIESADRQGRVLRRAIYLGKAREAGVVRGLKYLIPYIKNSEFFENAVAANLGESPLYRRLEGWARRRLGGQAITGRGKREPDWRVLPDGQENC